MTKYIPDNIDLKYINTNVLSNPEIPSLPKENNVELQGGSTVMSASSVDKDDTLLMKLKTTPNENLLRQTVRVGNVEKILNQKGSITLFAPTDRAFEFLPVGLLEYISAQPRDVNYVLKSHIIEGVVLSSEFYDGMMLSGMDNSRHQINFVYNASENNNNENNNNIDNNAAENNVDNNNYQNGHWVIDGIRILKTDSMASNGVLHTIDGIMSSHMIQSFPNKKDVEEALIICKNDKQFTGYQLAACIRSVSTGLGANQIPTRPDL